MGVKQLYIQQSCQTLQSIKGRKKAQSMLIQQKTVDQTTQKVKINMR